MRKPTAIILTSMCLMVSVFGQYAEPEYVDIERQVRFAPLDIYIDSGSRPLAAFQFELQAVAGHIEIVGVESGEHPAYKEPPYYDPAALANDRIIIAAFNTGSELPTGRTRVATVHLAIYGDIEPEYRLELTVAGDIDGSEIPAEITFEKGA